MSDRQYTIVHASDQPDVRDASIRIAKLTWPKFMMHDSISNRLWPRLYDSFPNYQFALETKRDNSWLAVGHAAPLRFDSPPSELPDEGWDWALERAFSDAESGTPPNALCALMIAVHPDHRSRALSPLMVSAMRDMATENGFRRLLVPARPSQKSRYVLTPMDKYIAWRTDNGRLFDPWLRTHEKLGAKVIRICKNSMEITGTVAEWEEWTEMELPISGWYIIPGALSPVLIDRDSDKGSYIEPNVWMVHDLT